jgi:hypothetical protein
VFLDGIQQRLLLLAKVGRNLIINIGEQLLEPMFRDSLSHLNGLQNLHRYELRVSDGHL